MIKELTSKLKDQVHVLKVNNTNLYISGPAVLPIKIEQRVYKFNWYCWFTSTQLPDSVDSLFENLSSLDLSKMQQSSVLTYGNFANASDPLVRFHSICHTGDIFNSQKCDCGFQLRKSLKMIIDSGCGALFYLADQEGRSIGLFNKNLAYFLQQKGVDTFEANSILGFEADNRNYSEAIALLKYFRGDKSLNLITNNPDKIRQFVTNGINIKSVIPLWGNISEYNEFYIDTKISKGGHLASNQLKNN